jgi:hypothetical protein
MADANHEDFYRRVDRIQQMSRRGAGFEAAGAIGRSYYNRARRQPVPIFRILAIILLVFVGLKGVIHAQVGAATYQKRVEALQAGTPPERLSAYVLKADGLTLFLSNQIRQVFPRF